MHARAPHVWLPHAAHAPRPVHWGRASAAPTTALCCHQRNHQSLPLLARMPPLLRPPPLRRCWWWTWVRPLPASKAGAILRPKAPPLARPRPGTAPAQARPLKPRTAKQAMRQVGGGALAGKGGARVCGLWGRGVGAGNYSGSQVGEHWRAQLSMASSTHAQSHVPSGREEHMAHRHAAPPAGCAACPPPAHLAGPLSTAPTTAQPHMRCLLTHADRHVQANQHMHVCVPT